MRAIVILIGILIFAALSWQVAMFLSPDAVGMAVGMLFGVLAGIPTALLMLASERRSSRYDEDEYQPRRVRYYPDPNYPYNALPSQPTAQQIPTTWQYEPVSDDEPLEW